MDELTFELWRGLRDLITYGLVAGVPFALFSIYMLVRVLRIDRLGI